MLNPQQASFVVHYAKLKNATKAAVAAGYSPKTAYSQGQRLLKNVEVQEAVKIQLDAQAARTMMTADRMLHEVYRIATVDVGEALGDNGELRPMKEIPQDLRRAISSIEVEEIWEMEGEGRNRHKVQIGNLKKVRFWSKDKSLELVLKHLGELIERHKHTIENPLEDIIVIQAGKTPDPEGEEPAA